MPECNNSSPGDSTPKRRLGILGGMGPTATILMMSRIIERTAARDDRDHIPMLVDCNTQVPSRIDAIVHGGGSDPEAILVSMARGLEAGGAEGLAMPCNTAHLYMDSIAGAVKIPFLDMVTLTAERLGDATRPGARIGVLASPAVVQTGLYDRALWRLGLETVYPPDGNDMLRVIQAVKAGTWDAPERAAMQATSEALIASEVTAIAVACTELSVLAAGLSVGAPVVDALDVLVDASIDFAVSPGISRQQSEALLA